MLTIRKLFTFARKKGDLPIPADAKGEDSFEARKARHRYKLRRARNTDTLCKRSIVVSVIVWVAPVLYQVVVYWISPITVWLWAIAPFWVKLFLSLTLFPALSTVAYFKSKKKVEEIEGQKP